MTPERCSLKWRFTNFLVLVAACTILMANSCGLALHAQTIRII